MSNLPTILSRRNTGSLPSLLDEFFRDDFFAPFDRVLGPIFRDFERGLLYPEPYPKVNVVEYPTFVKWELSVTGIPKEDIEVGVKTLEGKNFLTINYDKKSEARDDGTYHLREIRRSSFRRVINLLNNFDVNTMKAKCDNGLLTIEINKTVATKPKEEYRKIDVV